MDRRSLLKAAAVLPFVGGLLSNNAKAMKNDRQKIIKPKRLSPGDTVAVIAPSSGVSAEAFEKALANIASLGFKTKVGKFARGAVGFLSAIDKERLQDLHWAFSDPEVAGVWCVRGGSGAPRLLPDIDYDLIKRNPKVFIGYSDITALHVAIHQATGLVTFHGPVGTSEQSDYTKEQVLKVLTSGATNHSIKTSDYNRSQTSELFKTQVIVPGKCKGQLIGGNLSLLAAIAGTPYALKDLKGKILFLEDINEPPYKVDRLLTQLRQSTDIKQVAGVALGIFSNGDPTAEAPSSSIISVFKDRLGELGVPVIYGLSFGHIRDNCTLPYGVEAELDTAAATITLTESAVK